MKTLRSCIRVVQQARSAADSAADFRRLKERLIEYKATAVAAPDNDPKLPEFDLLAPNYWELDNWLNHVDVLTDTLENLKRNTDVVYTLELQALLQSQPKTTLDARQIGSSNIGFEDRYVVSFTWGASDQPDRTPVQAAKSALTQVRSDDPTLHWFVYDRQTQCLLQFTQSEIENAAAIAPLPPVL